MLVVKTNMLVADLRRIRRNPNLAGYALVHMRAMAGDEPEDPGGFEEAQAAFVTPAALLAILAAYDYRCAFTAQDLTAEALADPLVALLRLNGAAPIAPGNVIPASLDAIHAFERGHLAIGPRFEFLAALDRINPEFLERLNPIGRLTLPKDPAFYPNAALLKAHREEFAEGFIE